MRKYLFFTPVILGLFLLTSAGAADFSMTLKKDDDFKRNLTRMEYSAGIIIRFVYYEFEDSPGTGFSGRSQGTGFVYYDDKAGDYYVLSNRHVLVPDMRAEFNKRAGRARYACTYFTYAWALGRRVFYNMNEAYKSIPGAADHITPQQFWRAHDIFREELSKYFVLIRQSEIKASVSVDAAKWRIPGGRVADYLCRDDFDLDSGYFRGQEMAILGMPHTMGMHYREGVVSEPARATKYIYADDNLFFIDIPVWGGDSGGLAMASSPGGRLRISGIVYMKMDITGYCMAIKIKKFFQSLDLY